MPTRPAATVPAVTRRTTLLAGASVLLLATACTSGSVDGPSPIDKVGTRTATGAPTATKDATGKVKVPASMDAGKLGAGWAAASTPVAAAGLYEPCGEKVTPSADGARVFAYSAPGGYRVLVENAIYTGGAKTKRAAVEQALLNCGAGEDHGAMVTNALLGKLGKLDSAGAHIVSESPSGKLSSRGYWTVATGDLLVTVLVTPASTPGNDSPGGVVDNFAAKVTQAAVAAATGKAYGPVSVPDPKDFTVKPNSGLPGDAAAGGPSGQSGAPSSDSGTPDVVVQLPELSDSDPAAGGPGPVDGTTNDTAP